MEQPKDVFQYGDGTLMQLREQPLELGEEFGTRVLETVVDVTTLSASSAAAPATLEQKIDVLMAAVVALQRRLDSIDATLARALAK